MSLHLEFVVDSELRECCIIVVGIDSAVFFRVDVLAEKGQRTVLNERKLHFFQKKED